jgi:toxin CcdB
MADFLMARFDVYATPGRHVDSTPYLLDVQSDLLDGLDSRVVIPLRRRERFPAVPLAPEQARVTAAMDFLFQGF